MKQLLVFFLTSGLLLLRGLPVAGQPADASYQALPFAQDWTNTSLITTNDDWSGVPGVVGFRGDNLTSSTGFCTVVSHLTKANKQSAPTPRRTIPIASGNRDRPYIAASSATPKMMTHMTTSEM